MKKPIAIGLILLAGAVTGQETPSVDQLPEVRKQAALEIPADLDPAALVRHRDEGTPSDLFAVPPPPAALGSSVIAPAPPQPPSAPPLPYSYLGRMTKADTTIVYLLRNQEMVIATAGDTLDNAYRVESITETALNLVYLPLGTAQALKLPAEP